MILLVKLSRKSVYSFTTVTLYSVFRTEEFRFPTPWIIDFYCAKSHSFFSQTTWFVDWFCTNFGL